VKALIALLVATSACSLYGGGSTQRDAGCAVAKEPAPEELIDPSTNQCDSFPLGGGGGCECEPCPGQDGPEIPNWAPCDSACTGLAEQACLATSGCHATYQSTPVGTSFWTCDSVAPAGGATGTCATLDAEDCSTRDDCTATFSEGGSIGGFSSCAPEVPLAACTTLTTEGSCTARGDCEAVYTGTNCTCDEHGCTCASETFAYCETPAP
jgi:hypothetical protein